ncbi:MAG: hypothetical protein KF760_26495 [Candidatus Eremiobacteraeota bacterium]|nr:hypothetical protein [Candidatus Eremiobacteraeota bacterium]MCW5870539.1 hypothetical protein [Candidatus Eremiobacteraeota bacterium]
MFDVLLGEWKGRLTFGHPGEIAGVDLVIHFPIQYPANSEALRRLPGEAEEQLRLAAQAGMVTACLLKRLGIPGIWEKLKRARGVAVPDTDEQERFRFRGAATLDEALGLL